MHLLQQNTDIYHCITHTQIIKMSNCEKKKYKVEQREN